MSSKAFGMFEILARYSRLSPRWRGEAIGAGGEGRRDSEALVRGLAARLYRQALTDGGWAADIGALGPRAFERDARWLVAEVALGCAQGGPPSP